VEFDAPDVIGNRRFGLGAGRCVQDALVPSFVGRVHVIDSKRQEMTIFGGPATQVMP
jgi:hypothetical protein